MSFPLQKKKHRQWLPVLYKYIFQITGAVVTVGAVAVADVEAMEDDAWLRYNAFSQALYDTGCFLHNNALISGDVSHISF
mgnify:CR=1 FL=1